jgi:hypothetical protein
MTSGLSPSLIQRKCEIHILSKAHFLILALQHFLIDIEMSVRAECGIHLKQRSSKTNVMI